MDGDGANGKPDWDASILKLSETISTWAKETDPSNELRPCKLVSASEAEASAP